MSSTTKDVISLLGKQMELIDDVMDNFDFHKVRKVMKFLNWTWAFSDNAVPEVHELRKEARRHLNRALSGVLSGHSNYMTSSGGFTARAKRYDPETSADKPIIQLSLTFELENWDADTEMFNDD